MRQNPPVRVGVFASGSSGNATLFDARGTRVLVDAGCAPRTLARRLREAALEGPLDAIVVTHGHADHVGHSAAYAERLGVPVYMTEATARAARMKSTSLRYAPREAFAIGALEFTPTPVPHDAAQVALVVSDGAHRVALATDLGEAPPSLAPLLDGCDAVLLESNHDLELLARGPYPPYLKKRIASARGHLSNEQCAELLRALSPRTHTVVLMHLSRRNNRPELALDCARDAVGAHVSHLLAARQDDALVLDLPRHTVQRREGLTADPPDEAPAKSHVAKGKQLALPFR